MSDGARQARRSDPAPAAANLASTALIVTAPATGRELGRVAVSSDDDVRAAVARARAAAGAWARLPVVERAGPLEAAAAILQGRANAIGALLAEESGKIIAQATFEVRGAAGLLKANAWHARTAEGRLLPSGAWRGVSEDIVWEERVPLGVVAAILPFNFPVELLVEKAAAALAVGDAVIVKPPEQDPLAVMEAVSILHEAGIPRDCLIAVNGGGAVGASLAAADGVDAISLTGSTRAGVAVSAATATTLRRLHLELGGNDAAIVLDDADLELAVSELVPGRLMMNGQSCASNKRLIVQRAIVDRFLEALVATVRTVTVGDPLDPASTIGPLIDAGAAERVSGQVRRAVDEGARLVLGDARPDAAFLSPQVLADVPPGAAVALDDEIFGPVFTVIPVETQQDAIAVANASSFGLMGSVFSVDVSRALAVGDRLETGGVVINGSGNYRPPFIPFGGTKMSGQGREGIGYAQEELSRSRFTVLRRMRHRG